MTKLTTIAPVVTFTHADGSAAGAPKSRSVRLYGSQLCVQRGTRLLPVTVTGASNVTCNLAAKPLYEGLGEKGTPTAAQAIAPVLNREKLLAVQDAPAAAPKGRAKGKRGSAKAPEAEAEPNLSAVVEEALKGLDRAAKVALLTKWLS